MAGEFHLESNIQFAQTQAGKSPKWSTKFSKIAHNLMPFEVVNKITLKFGNKFNKRCHKIYLKKSETLSIKHCTNCETKIEGDMM